MTVNIGPQDYRMKYRPARLTELWNYGSSPMLRLLHKQAQTGTLSQLSVFHGPCGCGKTSVARILGLWSACRNLGPVTGPCLECAACRECMSNTESYVELDGTSSDIVGEIENVYQVTRWHRRGGMYSAFDRGQPNQRGNVVAIDEAHSMPGKGPEILVKMVEDWEASNVILLTTELGSIGEGLLSRAIAYPFTYPTEIECIQGLERVARAEELGLADEILRSIVEKVGREPRRCLGALMLFAPFRGNPVSIPQARSLLDAMAIQ